MNRDFKGIWIPREIWLNKGLSIQAKALWSEIWSLHDRESGGCYASNEYLCEFMDIKISRLKELTKELRDAGLLEDVSFDGRHRVIRSITPETDYGGQLPAGIPASCQPENRLAPSRKTGHPSILDISIEQRREENTSLKVPVEPNAAKAAEMKIPSSPKQRSEFPLQVHEVAQDMIDSLVRAKPDYLPPRNLSAMLTEVDFMLRLDKRDPQRIKDVFRWCVSDTFWSDKMYKPNPAKYFRPKFDEFDQKMKAKPYDPKKVDRRRKDKFGNPIVDDFKDNLF